MSDERLNLTEHDFALQDEGSIVVLHPENDAARSWIDENLYADGDGPQWWGGGVVIEPRYVIPVVEGLVKDGFTIH